MMIICKAQSQFWYEPSKYIFAYIIPHRIITNPSIINILLLAFINISRAAEINRTNKIIYIFEQIAVFYKNICLAKK